MMAIRGHRLDETQMKHGTMMGELKCGAMTSERKRNWDWRARSETGLSMFLAMKVGRQYLVIKSRTPIRGGAYADLKDRTRYI